MRHARSKSAVRGAATTSKGCGGCGCDNADCGDCKCRRPPEKNTAPVLKFSGVLAGASAGSPPLATTSYLADAGTSASAPQTNSRYPAATDLPFSKFATNLLGAAGSVPTGGTVTFELVKRVADGGTEVVLLSTTYMAGEFGVKIVEGAAPVAEGDTFDVRATVDFVLVSQPLFLSASAVLR